MIGKSENSVHFNVEIFMSIEENVNENENKSSLSFPFVFHFF